MARRRWPPSLTDGLQDERARIAKILIGLSRRWCSQPVFGRNFGIETYLLQGYEMERLEEMVITLREVKPPELGGIQGGCQTGDCWWFSHLPWPFGEPEPIISW